MRALVSRAYGPVKELSYADVPVPVPGPGQVLIRAEAAGLNTIDVKLVTGAMRGATRSRTRSCRASTSRAW
ncbi:MDR/zinc-dependent alcohol dehydrogenase-like family protein [Streptosporangium soli]|nr:hypothetical protein [Streptosporangium sp. KLBMP 9127]